VYCILHEGYVEQRFYFRLPNRHSVSCIIVKDRPRGWESLSTDESQKWLKALQGSKVGRSLTISRTRKIALRKDYCRPMFLSH